MTVAACRASWAAALLLVVACEGVGSARLQGRWRGIRVEGASGDAANAFALGTEIRVDGYAMTVQSHDQTQSGRYRVVREDATTVVLVTDADGPGAAHTFTFGDDGTMRWQVLAGKAIVFARE
jgi:hypothetical protein